MNQSRQGGQGQDGAQVSTWGSLSDYRTQQL
jgi:hypothetical protein